MALTFDIVSSHGLDVHEEGLERIVLRRREERFDPGSEVAIYPHHGPLLMQVLPCRVRLVRHDGTRLLDVPAGVVEVLDDRVTLVVT